MNNFSRPKRFIFFPLIGVAFLFLVSGIVMLLWNSILPAIFNINAINYWQAMGILVLCKILFGFKGGRPGWGRHFYWQKQMREKFANMTPEERKNFKEEWKQRAAEWHAHPGCTPRSFNSGWKQPGENTDQPAQNDQ
jgi:hypothetical protein